jgi:catechol 2,3-dioxygenase-like lactoylglutathione lyase family enzyme
MAVELNHTIVPAHYPPRCRQPGQVYTSANGRRGLYFRDPNGHLMEILTPLPGKPA